VVGRGELDASGSGQGSMGDLVNMVMKHCIP
jgi:hypothetical protein